LRHSKVAFSILATLYVAIEMLKTRSNDQESFFAEVGLGNLDIKNIVKTATDSDCKWFIVEQDECNGDPFDSLQISYNNLVKYAVT
jgi:sugar phosphate isomerase/epimerase